MKNGLHEAVKAAPGSGERILLVDDDPDAREAMQRRLSRRGYAVETVEGAQEALRALGEGSYDLMLLDHNMPGMTGLELLPLLRATYAPSELPVVMLTAQADSAHLVRALELGANDYLTKPVDIDVALARIGTQIARKKAEAALRESEQRYALAARGTNDGLWDWDLRTSTIYYSPRWCEVAGYSPGELRPDPMEWMDRIHPEDSARLRRQLEEHLNGQAEEFAVEHRIAHRDGTYRWVLAKGLAVRAPDGKALRIAGSLSDITENKLADSLTGLANRVRFTERLAAVIERYARDPSRLYAILFFDLDRFKLINDTFGHATGDAVLKEIARRLVRSVRNALPARFGGDEFAVLVEDIAGPDVAPAIGKRLIDVLKQPVEVDGRPIYTSASVGVAVGMVDTASPEELLRDADLALYRAKQNGRGRVEVFDDSLRAEALRRMELESELRQALTGNQFQLYYQPKVRLKTGQIEGLEALVRWQHPERGLVPPGEFISIAEDTGLIIPLGRWVLREACEELMRMRSRNVRNELLTVAVNVSVKQLRDPDFFSDVTKCLEETGLPPELLCLEITEAVFLDQSEDNNRILHQIRELGVAVQIDDFGTGYSSLAYLSRLPVSGLKIDRSFIAQIGEGSKNREIVRSIMALAAATGLEVVAEGIEMQTQIDELLSAGCENGQGYFYSRPVPPSIAKELLQDPSRLPKGGSG